MLKKLALAASAFAVGFGLVYYNVPVIGQALALILAPIAGPAASFAMSVIPHLQEAFALIKENWKVVTTLISVTGVGVTLLVNYIKNRQILKMQNEAISNHRELQSQLINAQNLNVQTTKTYSELKSKAENMSQELKLLQTFQDEVSGVKQELRSEIDNKFQQMHGDLNYILQKIKEVENKRVPTYVP